jgi:Carboxypeptidase regulatory-like domain/TonB dependent receptor
MLCLKRVVFCFAIAVSAMAQSDRGTITGAVTDQAGAVVPSVEVVLKNVGTDALYKSVTTSTGDYTAASLPVGSYELTISAPGFKIFHQSGITAQVAQTVRVDVVLQIGTASESVEIHGDATLLQTESSEQSTTIDNERLQAMPLYFGSGQGGGAIRNPLTFASLVPGAVYQSASNEQIRVNGFPNQTFTILLEGQDATNGLTQQNANTTMPAMEAVEEFTLQSSNFAAEFGQVSGGLFNFTTKSGTNQYHGSAFEYLTNTDFNAGVPFTNAGNGQLVRPATHKSDWGVTVGGPVRIPKLYNGKDKTFFFFNYEGYDDYKNSTPVLVTVPTAAMRAGNFSGILDGRNLGTSVTGAPILENTIYDPATRQTVNGNIVTAPFPGNIIPASRIDPSAAKVQALIPMPQTSGNLNNFTQVYPNNKTQYITSFKIDQNFGANTKLSFYYGYQNTHQLSSPDGLPAPLTSVRDQLEHSDTFRLNIDRTITPALLLHFGIGEQHFYNPDSSPASVLGYDAVGQLGITGGAVDGMPRLSGLSNSFGGLSLGLGPTNGNHYTTEKPTAVTSLTWVRGSHTYKAGGQFRLDAFSNVQVVGNGSNATGSFTFSGNETGLPYLQSTTVGGGTIGNPYASFLLGGADSASVSNVSDPQWRRHAFGLFVQDTWKISNKLTLDYGLRWDWESFGHELYYRSSSFDPYEPNPSAGGLLGATTYEGYGPGRCNCTFAHTYPYALGPRLGFAYQVLPKTVLRGGWGVSYGLTPSFNYPSSGIGVGFNTLNFTSSAFGLPAAVLSQGLQYNPAALNDASYNPGIVPSPGQINSPPYIIDRNAGRPPRVSQWNISLQRELTKDLLIEAAFVGNRGVWLQANNLGIYNQLSPQRLATFGLSLNNPANLTLLASPLNSAQVVAAGFKAPYPGFPATLTLAQALRPFPQFGNITVYGAPLGNSWYDALQVKLTKRFSRGLSVQSAFTWSQELTTAENAPVNDVFNYGLQKTISANSQPLTLVVGYTYELPGASLPRISSSKFARAVLGGWTLGGLLRYSSGLPIQAPAANNNLGNVLPGSSTFAIRVPGVPLFLDDLNCHCFDPSKTFVLNPAAWTQPAAGQFGTSSIYFNDYRYQRRPDEEMSFGRTFRLRERMSLAIRMEFFNVFNRTEVNNPTATNSQATQVLQNGLTASGFGYINAGSVAYGPRSGQLVAQFHW